MALLLLRQRSTITNGAPENQPQSMLPGRSAVFSFVLNSSKNQQNSDFLMLMKLTQLIYYDFPEKRSFVACRASWVMLSWDQRG